MSKYNEKITNKYLPTPKNEVLQKRLTPQNDVLQKKYAKNKKNTSLKKNWKDWVDSAWRNITDAVEEYFDEPSFMITRPNSGYSRKTPSVISRPSSADYRRSFTNYYRTIPGKIRAPIIDYYRTVPDPLDTIVSQMYQTQQFNNLYGTKIAQPWWTVIKQTGTKGHEFVPTDELISLLDNYMWPIPFHYWDSSNQPPVASKKIQIPDIAYSTEQPRYLRSHLANVLGDTFDDPSLLIDSYDERAVTSSNAERQARELYNKLTNETDKNYAFSSSRLYRDIDEDALESEANSTQFRQAFPELTDAYAARVLGTENPTDANIDANERAFVQQLKPTPKTSAAWSTKDKALMAGKKPRPPRQHASAEDAIISNKYGDTGFIAQLFQNPNISTHTLRRFFTAENFPYSYGEFMQRADAQDIDEILNAAQSAIKSFYKRNTKKKAKNEKK